MQRSRRKYGRAIGPITDPATGEVLGWAYQWDNGQESRVMKVSDPWGAMTLDPSTSEARPEREPGS